jgi:hypothetical protein
MQQRANTRECGWQQVHDETMQADRGWLLAVMAAPSVTQRALMAKLQILELTSIPDPHDPAGPDMLTSVVCMSQSSSEVCNCLCVI